MKEICRNCQFYSKDQNCFCPKFKYGYHQKLEKNDEIIIEDDEGWGLMLGEEFGCIHFKAYGD